MATKNHKRSMSQPERAFWREAFLAAPVPYYDGNGNRLPHSMEVVRRADFADAAVAEYRDRITWRQP